MGERWQKRLCFSAKMASPENFNILDLPEDFHDKVKMITESQTKMRSFEKQMPLFLLSLGDGVVPVANFRYLIFGASQSAARRHSHAAPHRKILLGKAQ